MPWALPGDAVVKNLPANIQDLKDAVSTPGLGRSLRVGNGNLLQHSCLENSMDRGGQGTLEGYNPWGCKESDMT